MNTPIFVSQVSFRCRSVLALSVLFPFLLLSAAQQPQSRSDRPPEAGQKDAGQKRGIRVEVNLVNVLSSVLDKDNRPAPDLPADAFELYEEGVAQKIEIFEKETQQPLDLALMIDSSLSAQLEMPFEREAAAHFIRQVVRPGDSISVYAFDEDVHQLSKFSSDVPTLQQAVRGIQEGAGTSIYDALYLGSQALGRRPDDHRRVIVLVTDAGETTSRADFQTARNAALRSGALLYT
ncbi:MAG TPA: VWA domain-containing protein, partial [Candidatus Acidoferrales bacterium]|nr:VWA domain-containing protein [Candidatus Acidoferrales bacterium]